MKTLPMIEKRKIVEATARGYAKKCWWADELELQQQAWLVLLDTEARGTWRSDVGVPLAAYLWRACGLGVRRWLLQQSNAVTMPVNMLGVHVTERAPLVPWMADKQVPADLRLDEAVWLRDVRVVLDAIAEAEGLTRDAVEDLLDGQHGKPINRLRKAVGEDLEAYNLMQARMER
jgi:hypothetical protein